MATPNGYTHINGRMIAIGAIWKLPPPFVAEKCGLTLHAYLELIDRWSKNEGLPYGVEVDMEAQTVTR